MPNITLTINPLEKLKLPLVDYFLARHLARTYLVDDQPNDYKVNNKHFVILVSCFQAVMNTVMEGSELAEVMQRPRLHHQLVPMEIEYEEDFNPVRALTFIKFVDSRHSGIIILCLISHRHSNISKSKLA